MRITARLAVLLALLPATLLAHHSLSSFDTSTAVRVKGTIVRIHQMNPHSFIFLEQKGEDGRIQRWAVEGPSVRQLNRADRQKVLPKAGDVVEVCGYEPRERTVWQIASADQTAISLSGRLLNGELLVMPDGEVQSWGDYGVHKCFESGYTDQHSK